MCNKIIDLDTIVNEKDNQTIEKTLAAYLVEQHQTIAFAESCTGGYMSHLLTALPGSSLYFKGSVVAYANEIKTNILHVSNSLLTTEGAVSEATVVQMAENVRQLFQTDYAIAVSGIAGPEGGTPQKPLGTVWMALAMKDKMITELFQFGNAERGLIIRKTAIFALSRLNNLINHTKH